MRAHMIAAVMAVGNLAAIGFLPQLALAQNVPTPAAVSVKPIGKVASVKGTVTIKHVNAVVVQVALGDQTPNAKVGDPVYLGDIVQTGPDGHVGITFADDTAFNMSSNARMTLNKFVYDPNGKSNSTFFRLSKGVFTFVAGKIAKTGDMEIDTPVATMGIRGTTPHVSIAADGSVKFSTLFEDGKAEVLKKYGTPLLTPTNSPSAQPHKKLNLNICKGC